MSHKWGKVSDIVMEIAASSEPEVLQVEKLDDTIISFLMAFLVRAVKDYVELDPESTTRSSEYSDDLSQGEEWYTAHAFLFEEERVMGPWAITYSEICDLLGMEGSTLLSRAEKERKKRDDNRTRPPSTGG